MKEKLIIKHWTNEVFRNRSQNRVFSNVFLGQFEADILEITKAKFSYEYEIKTSVADFRKDALKSTIIGDGSTMLKSDILRSGQRVNYFYYIVPKDLVSVDDVPEYAGLIYANHRIHGFYNADGSRSEQEYVRFDTVKKAPRLSGEKFPETKLIKCFESIYS